MKRVWIAALILTLGTLASAQAPPESFPATATMKQLMLDLIHPASNDILLFVNRGAPNDEEEWAAVRRSAVTLAESGNLLMMRGPRTRSGRMDEGRENAGRRRRRRVQGRAGERREGARGPRRSLDASCTTCHKQYRPNVFPREGGSK